MKTLLRSRRNPFELAGGGWLERAYRRYRFRDRYARLARAPALDAQQRRMVDELQREGTLILRGYLSADTVRAMQHELQASFEALRFETPCLAQSRVDPERHRALIDNFLYGSNEEFARQGVAFERNEMQSLEQVLRDFNPSTITAYPLETSAVFRKVWLD